MIVSIEGSVCGLLGEWVGWWLVCQGSGQSINRGSVEGVSCWVSAWVVQSVGRLLGRCLGWSVIRSFGGSVGGTLGESVRRWLV